jgi:hypothetical protein
MKVMCSLIVSDADNLKNIEFKSRLNTSDHKRLSNLNDNPDLKSIQIPKIETENN